MLRTITDVLAASKKLVHKTIPTGVLRGAAQGDMAAEVGETDVEMAAVDAVVAAVDVGAGAPTILLRPQTLVDLMPGLSSALTELDSKYTRAIGLVKMIGIRFLLTYKMSSAPNVVNYVAIAV